MSADPRANRFRLDSSQRRRLLKAAAVTGLLAAVDRNFALAQTASDYKALVCINLFGGNDGENILIRYDSAGYNRYASVRPPASGINIGQSQLQPIQPASLSAPFGFHPACAPLKALFDRKQLAVIANVGVLAQPSTKQGLESQGAPRPASLFSHTDQQLAVQSADFKGATHTGWGGRIADRLDAFNLGTLFPPLISASGLPVFATGQTSVPLTVSGDKPFLLYSSGDYTQQDFQFDALRDAAVREILAQNRGNVYEVVAQLYAEEGFSASSVVSPLLQNDKSVVTPFFTGLSSEMANQLRRIALLIEGRAQTQLRRQVFHVSQNGYDTHGDQIGTQQSLLGDLSQSISAFYDALGALGIGGSVTTFTLSDFGRTFKPASNAGTDHGWGNYAFVMGGAVRGGDFYGTLPNQALGGPDDLGDAGRWIPTTSIEQYGATLCRWFGNTEGDLPYVFPNIGAFSNTNLGFMS